MSFQKVVVCLAVAASLGGCADQKMAAIAPYTDTSNGQLTWYRDVLPIARQHCQGCHSPDGIGPFSMMSYADIEPEIDKIGMNVAARIMPPWMPDPSCGSFVDDRRLSDDDMNTITQWVAEGGLAGDPSQAPTGGDAMAQHLATVSATLMPDTVYTPNGDPNDPNKLDDYHCFILDPKLTSDQTLIGYEIEPDVTREVHHVILYPAKPDKAAAADAATPEAGWTCFGGSGAGGNTVLGGWAPGMPPVNFPTDTGVQMNAGDVIVMQVHYNLLNGPPLPDRTIARLQYADGPVSKLAQIVPAVDATFNIPAHTNGYTDSISQAIPVDIQVWGVLPHMHTLGKHISVKTDSACLVDIPNWDFHWQQLYFYNQPVTVKAGESATLSCTWNNPRDTSVQWGEGTTDEMCVSFSYITLN